MPAGITVAELAVPYLRGFNPAQRARVEYCAAAGASGPLLIIAGAGIGDPILMLSLQFTTTASLGRPPIRSFAMVLSEMVAP